MTEPKNQRGRSESAPQTEGATGQVEGVLDQAKGIASQVADKTRSAVQSGFSARTTKSALELSELAEALRMTSRRLEGNVGASFIDNAASRIERVSDALNHSDMRQVVQNVESFARREPLLFLGGAFAVGVLGSRFLRSAVPAATASMSADAGESRTALPASDRSRGARAGDMPRTSS